MNQEHKPPASKKLIPVNYAYGYRGPCTDWARAVDNSCDNQAPLISRPSLCSNVILIRS